MCLSDSDSPSYTLSSGNWYLFGMPFLIKTRRMLDGMDTGGCPERNACAASYILLRCSSASEMIVSHLRKMDWPSAAPLFVDPVHLLAAIIDVC